MPEQAQEIDPLSEAVGDYQPTFPVLVADRIMEFTLKSLTKKVSEKGNTSLSMKVSLNKDNVFSDGKTARAGFTFMQNINITPSENFDIESVKRVLALWNKSLLGPEKGKQVPFAAMRDNPSMFEGLVFQARTGIKKDKNGVYGDQNTLSPIIPG